jgi:hypothetical protein
MSDKPSFHASKPEHGVVYAWEGEVAGLRAEIERLLGICKDKTMLLKDAYADNERLTALHVAAAARAELAQIEIERLRAAGQRALDHYDMRSELYTSDADVATGMASILRAAEPKP